MRFRGDRGYLNLVDVLMHPPAEMRALRAVMLVAAGVGLGACGIAPAESERMPARRVVLVSVDGLRADAIGHMPALSAMRARAQWTDSMMTVVPSLTVPGHLSLFSGRDVSTLGVTSNSLDERAAFTLMVNGATSLFQWVRAEGGRSVAIIGGQLVPQHQLAMAQTFFGLDALHAAPESTPTIVDQAIAVAVGVDAPDLLFVHISAVDAAGHVGGWVGPDGALTAHYIAAVRDVDAQLSRLAASLEPSLQAGEIALAITSDHGGGHGDGCVVEMPATREHCTSHGGDRRIPYLLVGAGITPGRLVGISSITEVAPTLAKLLQVRSPSQVGQGFWF